ncbi:Hypothetical protein, putative [Bodo saltans]|uniref:Uncharacterized protein n=1 Tax=Bodo saltans TaxID=75058 RepID=A0A0S4JBX8_BODSA|nr:Hypothetical protein, putative [Bodo saltans]|eukprot:CUG85590.1 Hypothetical protein, putative [Bodo saltans]
MTRTCQKFPSFRMNRKARADGPLHVVGRTHLCTPANAYFFERIPQSGYWRRRRYRAHNKGTDTVRCSRGRRCMNRKARADGPLHVVGRTHLCTPANAYFFERIPQSGYWRRRRYRAHNKGTDTVRCSRGRRYRAQGGACVFTISHPHTLVCTLAVSWSGEKLGVVGLKTCATSVITHFRNTSKSVRNPRFTFEENIVLIFHR